MGTKTEHIVSAKEKFENINDKFKYDPITGAYNKVVFKDYIERKLADNPDVDYDLVCVVVVAYHLLLDRYGKDRCDKMTQNICGMLRQVLPKDSVIGLIDDSQIAFLMPTQSFAEHVQAAEGCQKLATNTSIVGANVKCGVYQHVDHSLSAEKICHNAIMAADTIKNQYGVSVATYNTSIRERISREQFILENMTEAIKLRQFIVYYQPKIRLRDENINGAEALVRWIHPEAGFMNPGEFISIFEHNGFIQELDKYMLEAVCRDLRGWIDGGMEVVPVSINISQSDFDNSEMAEAALAIVDSYNIPHELIHFEITESVNASDTEKKIYNVTKLQEYGFKIELDDFGSGYSSMSSLCDMPIDTVKLDMSLVQKMFEKRHSAVLSGALFTARELALKVVAEGIETKEQVEEMKFRGANIKDLSIQGYYYSKPLPKIQFEKYLWPKEDEVQEEEYDSEDSVQSKLYSRSELAGASGEYENDIQIQKYKTLMEMPGTVIYEYDPLTDKMSMEVQRDKDQVLRRVAENYLETLPSRHWVYDEDLSVYMETIRNVASFGQAKTITARAITQNGGYERCRYHFAPIKNDSGTVIRVVGRAEIVGNEEDSEGTNIVTGTFRYRNDVSQKFGYVSESVIRMLGYLSEEDFRLAYRDSFINFVYEEDRARVIREINDQIKDDYIDYCEYRVKKADGSLMWVYDKGTLIRDEFGNEFFYVSITDLDEYKSRENHKQREKEKVTMKYKSESRQDKMTGLDNRDYSMKLIQKYIDSQDHGTFFMIDIDDFKQINDTRGHVFGDRVLCEFADALKTAFRDGDVIGRYGGDEFICYMSGVNKRSVAERKAVDLINKASNLSVGDIDKISVSIGIVTDVLNAKDINDLIDMADKALNDTKKRDADKYCFY